MQGQIALRELGSLRCSNARKLEILRFQLPSLRYSNSSSKSRPVAWYTHPPGQRPRKIWSFNFDDKDLLLLDRDLLLLGPCGWYSVFSQFRSVFLICFQSCISSFKWGSSQLQHWADIVFGRHLWLWYQKTGGAMRTNVEKIGDGKREEKKGWALSNRGKPKVLVKLGLEPKTKFYLTFGLAGYMNILDKSMLIRLWEWHTYT